MLRTSDFEGQTFGISDLVRDLPTIEKNLSRLETFLNDKNNALGRDMKLRIAEYIVMEMIDVGRIIEGTPEYDLLTGFCLRNFGKPASSYVAKNVTYSSGELVDFEK